MREHLAKPFTHRGDDDSQENSESATTGTTSKDKDFLNVINSKNPSNQGSKMTKFKTFNFEKRTSVKYSFPMCHFHGYNLWLLKPTHLNRGRGIHVFRDLESMHKLIREYCQGKDEEVKTAAKKESPKKG